MVDTLPSKPRRAGNTVRVVAGTMFSAEQLFEERRPKRFGRIRQPGFQLPGDALELPGPLCSLPNEKEVITK